MDHIGKWVFHSIATINDKDERVYLTPSEYLDSPMEYIDADDEEAVADEMKERKQLIGSRICDDEGFLHVLSSRYIKIN